jgi:hypothetical protein
VTWTERVHRYNTSHTYAVRAVASGLETLEIDDARDTDPRLMQAILYMQLAALIRHMNENLRAAGKRGLDDIVKAELTALGLPR